MKSLITRIRLATIGPRKVASVVRTFHKAAADLQEHADHHNAEAAKKRTAAASLHADAVIHDNNAAHALRVQTRIKGIIA